MRFLCIVMLLACAGCAELQHLDEALMLKDFAEEKDAQSAYVEARDAHFEQLLLQSKAPDAFKRYGKKESIVREFGEPILCQADGELERCLYRRIVKPMESPKVYFYFNAGHALVRWEMG